MDSPSLLDPLNAAQRMAVSAPADRHLLILAGAGSGKTRVLVHRIGWLLHTEGLPPWSLMAVTFTNKAAREMRGRLESMNVGPIDAMWVGTFHGLAHRFLRMHWQDAGLSRQFQILDSDDQFRLVRRLMKELQLDESRYPPRQMQSFINRRKDEGLRPEHLDEQGCDPFTRQQIRLYHAYEQARRRSGALDFADLLLYAHELLRNRPDLQQHYRERFRHILVDEFQDTNAIQYAWLRQLTGDDSRLFVVGDDDQSIYGWRGARIEHIQSFQHDYPDTLVIRLEQNYRSSGNILAAANALIAHNTSRLGKELWTEGHDGELIHRYTAFNETEEARFVVERIRAHVEQHAEHYAHCAILYRTTAQSRLFEEALLQAGLPYRVYGGLRFFERAEIRDAMAYLRLVANSDDDAAFERVVNTPSRGIGARTLDQLRESAREHSVSLWRAGLMLMEHKGLGARASASLRRFMDLIEETRASDEREDLPALTRMLIERVALPEYYLANKDGKGQDRVENLDQLVETAERFCHDAENTREDALIAFLDHAALEAGEAQIKGPDADAVQLMTLHTAKGLEFPLVFLVGLEEGLFPHSLSADDPHKLEEERRLCYVGMTRAMQHLYLTHAETRRLYGQERYAPASRFFKEIPPERIEEIRARGPRRTIPAHTPAHPVRKASADTLEGGLRPGQRVHHPTFGPGRVVGGEGSGRAARVQVTFDSAGPKWLVLAYARLETLD